ncbi:hypothetical protein T05_1163 [Trichinella murrelli]|uniref:FLYWCH-type domain-containing protein n=1 Tax=Trichinella murrelli TaxID=144512 RepID=A0A0V0TWY2_9BILA|nr:hypothetical protein T05_1163 [Trichinella murrelli]
MKFQGNQQKLVYRGGQCYTQKRTNCYDKCWICAAKTTGCLGTLSTNVEAMRVIRKKLPVGAHAFYKHHQYDELKRLVSEDLRLETEMHDELASNASTSSDTLHHFPT